MCAVTPVTHEDRSGRVQRARRRRGVTGFRANNAATLRDFVTLANMEQTPSAPALLTPLKRFPTVVQTGVMTAAPNSGLFTVYTRLKSPENHFLLGGAKCDTNIECILGGGGMGVISRSANVSTVAQRAGGARQLLVSLVRGQ